jgi:hypothetical protein
MLWLATTPAAPRAELFFTGRELEMSDIHPFGVLRAKRLRIVSDMVVASRHCCSPWASCSARSPPRGTFTPTAAWA